MKKLIMFIRSLFKRPADEQAEREDLRARTAEGSIWAVRHYGKAIEKLAEHDKGN